MKFDDYERGKDNKKDNTEQSFLLNIRRNFFFKVSWKHFLFFRAFSIALDTPAVPFIIISLSAFKRWYKAMIQFAYVKVLSLKEESDAVLMLSFLKI